MQIGSRLASISRACLSRPQRSDVLRNEFHRTQHPAWRVVLVSPFGTVAKSKFQVALLALRAVILVSANFLRQPLQLI
jgi:hypothetical protein